MRCCALQTPSHGPAASLRPPRPRGLSLPRDTPLLLTCISPNRTSSQDYRLNDTSSRVITPRHRGFNTRQSHGPSAPHRATGHHGLLRALSQQVHEPHTLRTHRDKPTLGLRPCPRAHNASLKRLLSRLPPRWLLRPPRPLSWPPRPRITTNRPQRRYCPTRVRNKVPTTRDPRNTDQSESHPKLAAQRRCTLLSMSAQRAALGTQWDAGDTLKKFCVPPKRNPRGPFFSLTAKCPMTLASSPANSLSKLPTKRSTRFPKNFKTLLWDELDHTVRECERGVWSMMDYTRLVHDLDLGDPLNLAQSLLHWSSSMPQPNTAVMAWTSRRLRKRTAAQSVLEKRSNL